MVLFAEGFVPNGSTQADGIQREQQSLTFPNGTIGSPGSLILTGPNASRYLAMPYTVDLRTNLTVQPNGSLLGASDVRLSVGENASQVDWRGFAGAGSGQFGLQRYEGGFFSPIPNRTRLREAVFVPENATIESAKLRISGNLANMTMGPVRELQGVTTDCVLSVDMNGDQQRDLVGRMGAVLAVFVGGPSGPGSAPPIGIPLPQPPNVDWDAADLVRCQSLGDINGDGRADLWAGFPFSPVDGRSYVGISSGTGLTYQWRELESPSSKEGYGLHAATGISFFSRAANDLLVAAPDWSNYSGRLYVYSGLELSSNLTLGPVPPRAIISGSTGDYLGGWGLANLGSLGESNTTSLAISVGANPSGKWRLYPCNGSATLAGFVLIDTPSFGAAGRMGSALDVNGDGFEDAILTGVYADTLAFGDSTGPNASRVVTGSSPMAPLLGDYDGDNRSDLLLGSSDGSGTVRILGWDQANSTLRGIGTYLVAPGAITVTPLAGGDLTGDGKPDMVAVGLYFGGVGRLLMADGANLTIEISPSTEVNVFGDSSIEWNSSDSSFGPIDVNLTDAFKQADLSRLPIWFDVSLVAFRRVDVDISAFGSGWILVQDIEVAYSMEIRIDLTDVVNSWLDDATDAARIQGVPLAISVASGSLGYAVRSQWDVAPGFVGLPGTVIIPEEGSILPPMDLWAYVVDDKDPLESLSLSLLSLEPSPANVWISGSRYLSISMALSPLAVNWTGYFNITLGVQNSSTGLNNSANLTIVVANLNDAPAFSGTIGPLYGVEHGSVVLDLSSVVVDSDTPVSLLTVGTNYSSASSAGLEITFNFLEGASSGRATVWVSDGALVAETTVQLVVSGVNDAPSVERIGTMLWKGSFEQYIFEVRQDALLELVVVATDPEGDLMALAVAPRPRTLVIDQKNLTVSWRPGNSDVGIHELSFTLMDASHQILLSIVIVVLNENDPPDCLVASPANATSWYANESIPLEVSCVDPDALFGEILNFTWKLEDGSVIGQGAHSFATLTGTGEITIVVEVQDGSRTQSHYARVKVIPRASGTGDPPIGDPRRPGEASPVPALVLGGAAVAVVVFGVAFLLRARRRVRKPRGGERPPNG